MGWIGKMIGGAVGFALGGTIGAVAGATLGHHAFDLNGALRLDGENDYAVLNCLSNDSDDHIKKQYRKLVSEYHPDKIASKGLPEDFTVFAAEKFQKIQEAYENIKRARGIA
jgi:DnaJ-domain-containing protein 1